ncbi:hypothetical protein [Kitasatospora sp. NPDC048538]|uniref:hypothetical protein n=1 Tax=unclassified Kitasatospora TaxID=2633591 RepID=UPI0033EBA771
MDRLPARRVQGDAPVAEAVRAGGGRVVGAGADFRGPGGEGGGDLEDAEGFEEFAGVGLGVGAGVGEEGVEAVVEADDGFGGRDVEGEADGPRCGERLARATGEEGVGLGGGGAAGEGVPGEGEEGKLHRGRTFRR